MDQQDLSSLLKQAESLVRRGDDHIRQQQEVIRQLDRAGFDMTEARRRLLIFKKAHALHIRDRNRLRAELRQKR